MTEPTPNSPGARNDVLTPSESLDEDELGADPLERGMDPPEGWSAADRYGTTAREQATDQPLAQRLAEERPDVTGEPVPEPPLAATPIDQLDDSIDDQPLAAAPAEMDGQVLFGDELDVSGESATRRAGHPARDEATYGREEGVPCCQRFPDPERTTRRPAEDRSRPA